MSRGKLTENDRREIAEALIAGGSPTDLARQYGVSRQYLSRKKSELQGRKLRRKAPAAFDFTTAREEIRHKGNKALQDGLDVEEDDPSIRLKRGRLELDALKGTGDLVSENNVSVNMNIQQTFANLPEEWRDRYVMKGEIERIEAELEAEREGLPAPERVIHPHTQPKPLKLGPETERMAVAMGISVPELQTLVESGRLISSPDSLEDAEE